jgi:hypothetical protein
MPYSGGVLEEEVEALGLRKDHLEDRALLNFGWIRAPAIKGVVIVPRVYLKQQYPWVSHCTG